MSKDTICKEELAPNVERSAAEIYAGLPVDVQNTLDAFGTCRSPSRNERLLTLSCDTNCKGRLEMLLAIGSGEPASTYYLFKCHGCKHGWRFGPARIFLKIKFKRGEPHWLFGPGASFDKALVKASPGPDQPCPSRGRMKR